MLEPHHRRDGCLPYQETQPTYAVSHRLRRHDGRFRVLDRSKRRLREDPESTSSRRSRWHDLRVLSLLHNHASANVRVHHRGVPVRASRERCRFDAVVFEGRELVQPVSDLSIIISAVKKLI